MSNVDARKAVCGYKSGSNQVQKCINDNIYSKIAVHATQSIESTHVNKLERVS